MSGKVIFSEAQGCTMANSSTGTEGECRESSVQETPVDIFYEVAYQNTI
jgi:hypothetical protein